MCMAEGRIQNGSLHVFGLLLHYKHFKDRNHVLIIFVSYHVVRLVDILIFRVLLNLSRHCMGLEVDQ